MDSTYHASSVQPVNDSWPEDLKQWFLTFLYLRTPLKQIIDFANPTLNLNRSPINISLIHVIYNSTTVAKFMIICCTCSNVVMTAAVTNNLEYKVKPMPKPYPEKIFESVKFIHQYLIF